MKAWVERAKKLLEASLEPLKQEFNELDWKQLLSADKKRLTEHLSAFANYPGGGYLVFGVSPTGILGSFDEVACNDIVNQLANLGRHALAPPITIDNCCDTFSTAKLLFIHVHESAVKPVHLNGKNLDCAFIRSGATTRKASNHEIGKMLLNSKTQTWEESYASIHLPDSDLRSKLDVDPIFEMIGKAPPTTNDEAMGWLEGEKFIKRDPAGGGNITNLGAVAAARNMADFESVGRHAIRVIVYQGLNKAKTKRELEGKLGYAIGFQGLIRTLGEILPQSEVIQAALRTRRTIYPEIALREIIANALIHQDFSLGGTGPLVEIFDDRIEVTNPGGLLPTKKLDRLIGAQAESRNERLARAFRQYRICEERGSGLIKAGLEMEIYGLPPIEFSTDGSFFKVTLYTPRNFAQMSAKERLEACYQHSVLRHLSGSGMTNKSLRERLKMPEKQRSMVSALIQDAVELKRIKPADPENRSKKFTEYVPYWA
jgi:predicted HTH transcriptional regulator